MDARPSPSEDRALPPDRARASAWFEVLIIFLIFFIHGAWPAPDVNEAHYLGKAKHYWDSGWCSNDFFCRSADAHQVFYWSFGWLTLWLPLPAVAWVGRLLTWALLAWAWRRLSAAIVVVPFAAILSAGLFLTLIHRSHMAGEWVVGGVEAKGFAFVFGLLGIEAVVRDRWNRAWLLLGAAAAFHVLVGGWLVVTAGFAWLVMRLGQQTDRPATLNLGALLVGGLLSLPGVIPAILLMRGVDPSVAFEATRIYAFERLPHHLVPSTFPWDYLLRFTAMVVGWFWLATRKPCEAPARRLIAMVNGSLLIAAVGLAIAFSEPWFPRQVAALLRYYWFRAADVLLPLGLGLLIARWIAQRISARSARSSLLLVATTFAVVLHLTTVMRQRGLHASAPADRRMLSSQDWREVCRWVSENTPEDAVFLTPRLASSFRWYADRAEVVSWKDVPQDAAGIVEWWRRLRDLHNYEQHGALVSWRSSLSNATPEELSRLAREYGATYVITESLPPLPLELVSPPNPSYSVYRLPSE